MAVRFAFSREELRSRAELRSAMSSGKAGVVSFLRPVCQDAVRSFFTKTTKIKKSSEHTFLTDEFNRPIQEMIEDMLDLFLEDKILDEFQKI